jgi:hypothetical protein
VREEVNKMEIKKFISKVVDKDWEWQKGKHEGKLGYFIRNPHATIMTDKGLEPPIVHYTEQAIKNHEWEALKRQIPNLTYVTRIVGYFSHISNWNKSKMGELKDRRKGDYSIGQINNRDSSPSTETIVADKS